MTWNRRYSLMCYIKSSLWVVPVLALLAAIALKRLAEYLGVWLVGLGFYDLQSGFFGVNEAEAHAILDRIFSLNLSCLVFTFGSLLVAIQVAGGQYTPRIIATTLLRDNVIRWIVGLFLFNLIWVNRTMIQMGSSADVPQFQIFLAIAFALASLIAFIVLIDYCAKLLRPVTLAGRIGEQGVLAIDSVYPNPTNDLPAHATPVKRHKKNSLQTHSRGALFNARPAGIRKTPVRTVLHSGNSSIVVAVNLDGLIAEAQRANCMIDLAIQVGDFLSVDEPLFYLHGVVDDVDVERLRGFVAMAAERTMEQDPMFAFRIEVDIAIKALSPAINDPTTAVLAIDQLNRMLRMVGRRSLQDHEILDNQGQPRVVFRTPDWEDFVHISFREIRFYGAGSLQVERRLMAMLDNLMRSLPKHRHAALKIEMELLEDSIAQAHKATDDAALARIPDTQGLGGASGVRA